MDKVLGHIIRVVRVKSRAQPHLFGHLSLVAFYLATLKRLIFSYTVGKIIPAGTPAGASVFMYLLSVTIETL